MTDEEFRKQMDEIDERLKQHLLSGLYRLERLEEQSGLRDSSGTMQRLPSLETHEAREIAQEEMISRIEVLEALYSE